MSAYYPKDVHSPKIPKRPPTPPRRPSRPRPAPKVQRPAPKIEVEDPSTKRPKISVSVIKNLIKRVPISNIVTPTAVADATAQMPWMWQATNFDKPPELKGAATGRLELPTVEMDIPAIDERDFVHSRPELVEVPYNDFNINTEGFTRSPKKGTVTVNVPDISIPPPLRVDPDPTIDIWNIPDDAPFTEIWPQPDKGPTSEVGTVRSVNPRAPSQLQETGVVIDVTNTKGRTQVRFRPHRHRASRVRKKDTKANRKWLKAGHKLINVTYGTYTEIMDAVEALAWNTYIEQNGKRIPAMALEDGKLVPVLDGILDGKYEVDIPQFVVDFAIMQSMDFLQAKFSQRILDQSVDQGWWQSPIGPQGFVSNLNKGI